LYLLTVHDHFEAAHRLYGYEGKCARLHGHTWRVDATVGGQQLDQRGMLLDFADVKQMLRRVTADFDHQYLNELEPFLSEPGRQTNPTAENLAAFIFQRLEAMLSGSPGDAKLVEVRIWESDSASATVRREPD